VPTIADFETAGRYLALNVSHLRQRRGWTQEQVSEATGVDVKHLQRLGA